MVESENVISRDLTARIDSIYLGFDIHDRIPWIWKPDKRDKTSAFNERAIAFHARLRARSRHRDNRTSKELVCCQDFDMSSASLCRLEKKPSPVIGCISRK